MNTNRTRKQQAGSVILEALIAILIFSIGILALVGMQASAVNSVADAKYRGTAGFLADQIIGTMWATRLPNNVAVAASNVAVFNPNPNFNCVNCDTSTNGNAWTQAWMANGVLANLPQGTASVLVNGTTVSVTIGWRGPHDAVPHRHVVSTVINN